MTVSGKRQEEGMLEGIFGQHSLPWLVHQQLLYQVEQLLVLSVCCQHVALYRVGGRVRL